mgnify:CR=1 FL=1
MKKWVGPIVKDLGFQNKHFFLEILTFDHISKASNISFICAWVKFVQ